MSFFFASGLFTELFLCRLSLHNGKHNRRIETQAEHYIDVKLG